jgi:fructose-specific phosphotransferase system IIC component
MNWVAAIGIYFFIPLLGVIVFALLCRWMRRTHLQSPPFLSYFILFATFGGWLLVCLTALFWKWSGMASLGVFSLVLVAPFVTAGVAFSLRSRRALSGFHRYAYIASVAYSASTLTALGSWLGVHFLLG